MVPQHRVAVVASTHDAVLGQPETGEVGKIAMGNSGGPRRRDKVVSLLTSLVSLKGGGLRLD